MESLEESKVLESNGEIVKIVTKETLSEFLTTYGDVLTDDDIKDFCVEFDTTGGGEFYADELTYSILSVFNTD